jgi:hypothetical protein
VQKIQVRGKDSSVAAILPHKSFNSVTCNLKRVFRHNDRHICALNVICPSLSSIIFLEATNVQHDSMLVLPLVNHQGFGHQTHFPSDIYIVMMVII